MKKVITHNELLSRTIDYMRFPLTVGVVYIHFSLADGFKIHGVLHGLDNPAWFFFIVNFVSEVLARACVPLFFIISGYLFFYGTDFNKNTYIRKLKSRIRTLLVPFILLNMIAILWNLKCFLPMVSSFYQPVEFHFTLHRIINTFLCNSGNAGIFVSSASANSTLEVYPINVPLWYVRDLMILSLMSPIIFWFIRYTGKLFIMFVGSCWLINPYELSEAMGGGVFSTINISVFFFSWGAYYGINKTDVISLSRKFRIAPAFYLMIASIDALTKGMEYNIIFHKVGILFGVVSVVVMFSYMAETGKCKSYSALSKYSFFIFALHYLFIKDIGKIVYLLFHVQENNPFAMISLYIVVPVITIFICIIFYKMMSQYAPRLCKSLTGGR